MQLTANELSWETGTLGSNPSLSVLILCQTLKITCINPLLECEQFQGSDISLAAVKSQLLNFIKNRTKEGSVMHVAVYLRDLNNGPWIGINEKEEFSSSSLLEAQL